jgi:hypothetical protein
MVEVGGSNPPGPTKIKNPPSGGFFGFGGVGLDEGRCSTNATKGAFGPPQQSEGARRVQSPEAMAIEDNPPSLIIEQRAYKFEFSRVKIAAWNLKLVVQDRS